MSVLICGFLLFGAAFLFHLAVWRIKKPASTIKALVVLFFLVLVVGMILLIQLGHVFSDSWLLPHQPFSYLYIVVLFLSLFMTYLFSYPAIEADSPSLVIVMRISQSGRSGLAVEKIKELLSDDLLVEPRLKDLVDAKLVDLAGSVYKINNKGRFFLKPFIIYRNFLGLGKGG